MDRPFRTLTPNLTQATYMNEIQVISHVSKGKMASLWGRKFIMAPYSSMHHVQPDHVSRSLICSMHRETTSLLFHYKHLFPFVDLAAWNFFVCFGYSDFFFLSLSIMKFLQNVFNLLPNLNVSELVKSFAGK